MLQIRQLVQLQTVFRIVLLANVSLCCLVGSSHAQLTDGFYGNSTYEDGELFGRQPNIFVGGTKWFLLDDSNIHWNNGAVLFAGEIGVTRTHGDPQMSLQVARRLWLTDNSILGFGVGYDISQTPNTSVFQQTAVSGELLLADWAVRANGYLPFGQQVRSINSTMGMGLGGVTFQGNNLIAQNVFQQRLEDTAMRGIDIEFAHVLGDWSGEAYVGYYNFQGHIGEDTQGIKGGVRGYITPSLAGSIEVSDDPLFGTNIFGGFTWFFGGSGGDAPRSLDDQLVVPVQRNHQVVSNQVETQQGVPGLVIMTDGGQPITVTHVDQNAGGGSTGTFEDPFLILPSSQTTNIVYVHADGSYSNQSYTLAAGQRFLGEGSGNTHMVMTDQLGSIILPAGNSGVNRPIIQAVNGQFALTSAANTEISNIQIANGVAGTRSGILGTMGLVNVNRTLIDGGSTGIDIIGGMGQFTFTDVDITNAAIAGLSINGGSAGVTFDSLSSISHATMGASVQVQNGHTGTLQFDGDIAATNGSGLQFDNADGQYDFRGTTTLNGGDAGIDILNGSDGTFTFNNPTITNPSTGPAVNIVGGTAQTTFSGLDITTTNTSALVVDSTGRTTIDNSTNTATIDTTGARAIDLNNVNVNMTFDRITATNSNAEGLDIDGVSGTFAVNDGDNSVDADILTVNGTPNGFAGIDIANSSMGTFTFASTDISNTGSHGALLNNAGTVRFSAASSAIGDEIGTSLINSTNGDAINSTNTNLVVTFARIGETGQILGDGIDITNNDGVTRNVDLIFNNVFGLGPVPDPTGAGVRINAQSGTLFANLDANFFSTDLSNVITQDGGAANSLILDMTGNSTLSTFTAVPTMQFVGSGTHSTIVRSWDFPNQVIGGITGSSGILFDRVTFDADGVTANGFQQVQFGAGDLDIGQVPPFTIARVEGNGLTFINTTGSLNIGTLNIANQNGVGLSVDNSGLGTAFDLSVDGGTIDTIGGDAIFLNALSNFSLNGTTISNMAGFDTVDVTSSMLSGSGNSAAVFSSNDGGGNTGTIQFNGGANSVP